MLQQTEIELLKAENEKFRAALETIANLSPEDFDEPDNEWGYAAVGLKACKVAGETLGFYKD